MKKKNSKEIYQVKSDDQEMLSAMRKARDTFPDFKREVLKEYARIIPVFDTVLVKAYFYDEGIKQGGEHLWLNDIEFGDIMISGTIVSSPSHLKSVRRGQNVQFPLERLSDWLYVFDGKAHGAYTVKLLRSRMADKELKDHDKDYPYSFD